MTGRDFKVRPSYLSALLSLVNENIDGVPYTFDIDEISSSNPPSSGGMHFNAAAVRATQTLASGENLIHALTTTGTDLFAVTNTSPGKMLKWTAPTNLASYSVLNFASDNHHNNPLYQVYDSTSGLIYVSFAQASTQGFHIDKVNPSAFTTATFVDVSSGSFGYISSPIVTDGTYLYVILQSNSLTDCEVRKYDLATGTLQGSALTITNKRTAHTLAISGSNLYFGGDATAASNVGRWVGTCTTSLSGLTTLDLFTDTNKYVTDDSCYVPATGHYYVGLENSSGGDILKIASDFSTYSTISTGFGGIAVCYGVFYDGKYLWALIGSSPGHVVVIDPITENVVKTITMQSGENLTNEYQVVGTSVYFTNYLSPASITRMPLQSSLTSIAIHNVGQDGINYKNLLQALDDGNGSIKGRLRIEKEYGGTGWAEYTLSSLTDNTTWLNLTVTLVDSSSPFPFDDNDVVVLKFSPELYGGDASTNTNTSVDGEVALFNSTSGKSLKRATGSGVLKLVSGVATIATAGTDYYNPGGTDVTVADGGTGSSTASGARTNLGLVIGTDVQAHDSDLDQLAAIVPSADGDLIRYNLNTLQWERATPGTVSADAVGYRNPCVLTESAVVPTNYGVMFVEYLEIPNGMFLEIANGGMVEIS